jgi:hypothetical protein
MAGALPLTGQLHPVQGLGGAPAACLHAAMPDLGMRDDSSHTSSAGFGQASLRLGLFVSAL